MSVFAGLTIPWRFSLFYCTCTCSHFCPPYRPWLVPPLIPLSTDIAVDERFPVLFPFLALVHCFCYYISRPCPCSLSFVPFPVVFHFPYMCDSFPISVSVLVLYPSCPVLSSFCTLLIFVFLLQFQSVSLFFTRLVLSCRLCPLQICIYVPFNVSTILGLKPSSCPVVFVLDLKFCFFHYLCHFLLSLTISFYPVFFACFFYVCTFFTFFTVSPKWTIVFSIFTTISNTSMRI